jgi:eukaryotic-like serine/threonine-protein kinase
MREIGRYVLVKEIASGGMGTVFLAHARSDAGQLQRVAIKKPHEAYLHDARSRQSFLREARIASEIHHPNVVRTIEVLEARDSLYYVMEYVDGESLSGLQRLAEHQGRRVPSGIALRILVDVLLGLHAVHDARSADGAPLGVIHRDVSPQNILVGGDGRAKITDFGIAKTATHQSSIGGGLKGKIRYVAPEQIRGEPITPAADIYSTCVIAWELLAGEPLFFGGSEAAILARILGGRLRPLADLAPGIPPALDEAIMCGLAARADARPPSARVLATRLERTGLLATHEHVAVYLEEVAGPHIRERATVTGTHATATASTEQETASVSVNRALDVGPLAAAPHERTLVLTPALPRHAPPRKSARFRRAAALVLLATTFAGAAGWQWHRRSGAAEAVSTDVVAAAPSVAPVADEPSAALSSSMPSASSVAHASPPPPPARTGGKARGERKPSARAAGAKVDCELPYFVDEHGIRRIRKECL